jgi:uridine kinase
MADRLPMKKLLFNPLFLAGLAVKLFLIFFLIPVPTSEWFAPFLSVTVGHLTLNPWAEWLAQGGTPIAFPYGYVMWFAMLPLAILCKLFGVSLLIGYGITLLLADYALLAVLQRMLPGRERLLLAVYWLSPIVIVATYGLGLNDIVPILILTVALYLVQRHFWFAAGVVCISAVSAKLSMVLALPFFLIYLIRNRALRKFLPQYAKGLLIGGVLFLLPFTFSIAGVSMLLSNPEMGKVYQLALRFGENRVYILPMAYLVMLYAAWRVQRLNFSLFNATLGSAFLLVVLLTPASAGWFVWIVPLLVFYQALSGAIAIVFVAIFSTLYILICLPALFPAISVNASPLVLYIFRLPETYAHTALMAMGIVLALRLWRETVSFNDYFRLSRKPFIFGIAGDSGAGKDTLADGIEGLFGSHSVARLSGDDYHLWDRQKPMWQVMTHLNPVANDLENYANDLLSLVDGKSIQSRHYDHAIGKMSHPTRVNSNHFIVASGLHSLYLPILRACYDLSIYLEIDEDLRRYYKLQRDMLQRGHCQEQVLSALEKREPDSIKFVRPQAAYADLIMSLQPIHPRLLDGPVGAEAPRVKLFLRSKHGLNEMSLTRVLVGVCGLHVDMNLDSQASGVDMTIEGDSSAEDMALAAKILFPRILEFLDIAPKWEDGVLGLMQLILLAHINQALNKRLI